MKSVADDTRLVTPAIQIANDPDPCCECSVAKTHIQGVLLEKKMLLTDKSMHDMSFNFAHPA